MALKIYKKTAGSEEPAGWWRCLDLLVGDRRRRRGRRSRRRLQQLRSLGEAQHLQFELLGVTLAVGVVEPSRKLDCILAPHLVTGEIVGNLATHDVFGSGTTDARDDVFGRAAVELRFDTKRLAVREILNSVGLHLGLEMAEPFVTELVALHAVIDGEGRQSEDESEDEGKNGRKNAHYRTSYVFIYTLALFLCFVKLFYLPPIDQNPC